MIVALAFVCMSLAVLQSTNVPSNSTDDGQKTPTDFNISSTFGDLLTTISISPEMFDNITTLEDKSKDMGCATCNTTVRGTHVQRVSQCENTVTCVKKDSHCQNVVTKLPEPTHVGNNDSYYRKKIHVSCGTTKGSTLTAATHSKSETSTLRKTVTTSVSTPLINLSKLELASNNTNNTVVTLAMESLKNFLNESNTQSTIKTRSTFRSTFRSTLTSPFMGKFTFSTKVMAHMAPPILLGSSVTSTASSNAVTEMTAEMAIQVSAVGKSNAGSIMTLPTATKSVCEEINVATANATRTMKPEKTTKMGNVVLMSDTDTTNIGSNLTTEATTDKTMNITPSATTMKAHLKTTEGAAKTVRGKITYESSKIRNRNTNGGTTQQVQKKETGNATKATHRTTPGVTKRVIEGSTKRGTKTSQGQTNATPNPKNVAVKVTTRKGTGKKTPAPMSGMDEMSDTASNARATIATEVLTQLLEMMDSTTQNESKATVDISRQGSSSTRCDTSMHSSSVTPSSVSTKASDRRAYLANELGKGEIPTAQEETTLSYAEDENNETDTDETDEELDTTDVFTGKSIWTSSWPMDSTPEEREVNNLPPFGNLLETTTQSTKTTQIIFEETMETTSKPTPTEIEEMAPPARYTFHDESTTEELEDVSSESTTSIIAVSNTRGKGHRLHKPFMMHPLERNAAAVRTNSGASHKSREKKTNACQSRHLANHERKKGTQSPSLSGFTSSKKQRKSLFRKNKNSETTPVKS